MLVCSANTEPKLRLGFFNGLLGERAKVLGHGTTKPQFAIAGFRTKQAACNVLQAACLVRCNSKAIDNTYKNIDIRC